MNTQEKHNDDGSITVTTQDFRVEIERDYYGINPIEDYYDATLYCVHRRYNLGHNNYTSRADMFEEMHTDLKLDLPENAFDDDGYIQDDYYELLDVADFEEILQNNNVFYEKLYLMNHGVALILTTSIDCRGGSAFIGFGVLAEESRKTITKEQEALMYINSFVSIYDKYLQGEVYALTLYNNENEIKDACGGFYGAEHAIEGANEIIEQAQREFEKNVINLSIEQLTKMTAAFLTTERLSEATKRVVNKKRFTTNYKYIQAVLIELAESIDQE